MRSVVLSSLLQKTQVAVPTLIFSRVQGVLSRTPLYDGRGTDAAGRAVQWSASRLSHHLKTSANMWNAASLLTKCLLSSKILFFIKVLELS